MALAVEFRLAQATTASSIPPQHTKPAVLAASIKKIDSEIRNPLMRRVCGMVFDSWKPAESYPHRAHIYAAQAAGKVRW